jgi:hypothetical protein
MLSTNCSAVIRAEAMERQRMQNADLQPGRNRAVWKLLYIHSFVTSTPDGGVVSFTPWPPGPLKQEAGWVPEPVWTLRGRHKALASAGYRTTNRPPNWLATTPTELSRRYWFQLVQNRVGHTPKFTFCDHEPDVLGSFLDEWRWTLTGRQAACCSIQSDRKSIVNGEWVKVYDSGRGLFQSTTTAFACSTEDPTTKFEPRLFLLQIWRFLAGFQDTLFWTSGSWRQWIYYEQYLRI